MKDMNQLIFETTSDESQAEELCFWLNENQKRILEWIKEYAKQPVESAG